MKTHALRAFALSPFCNPCLSFGVVCVMFACLPQELEGFSRLALKYNLFIISDEVSFLKRLLRPRRTISRIG